MVFSAAGVFRKVVAPFVGSSNAVSEHRRQQHGRAGEPGFDIAQILDEPRHLAKAVIARVAVPLDQPRGVLLRLAALEFVRVAIANLQLVGPIRQTGRNVDLSVVRVN